MIYRGRVHNGVVVLENPGALPEGAEVQVEMAARIVESDPLADPLFRMTELAVDTGVADLASNIDY